MNVSPSAPPDEADELHAVLANEYCRTVVAYFAYASETTAALDGLATVVVAEHDVDETEAEVALHHTALPKLNEAGIVDYDARSEAVHYHGHSALVVEDAEDTECPSNSR